MYPSKGDYWLAPKQLLEGFIEHQNNATQQNLLFRVKQAQNCFRAWLEGNELVEKAS